MSKYAWRTYIGENPDFVQKEHWNSQGEMHTTNMQWYRSADDPSKLILLYSVEKTNNYDDTGIKFKDRYIPLVTKKHFLTLNYY